jgi:hypothetical protein
VEIENNGFEDPLLGNNGNTIDIPGWTTMVGSGAWNPPLSAYPGEAPDGENVGYASNNNSLTQSLGSVLQADLVYILVARVGRRLDIGFPDTDQPTIRLRAGGADLTPIDSETPPPPPGQFVEWVRRYSVGAGHPGIGQALDIVLDGGTSIFSPGQVNFDQVLLFLE